mgnify:FL=1|jgi:hypothetical protein
MSKWESIGLVDGISISLEKVNSNKVKLGLLPQMI